MSDELYEVVGPGGVRLTIPETFNMTMLLLDRNIAEGRGGRTALVCDGKEITYADLLERTNRVGNALLRLGVEVEQRVMLLLHDTPEFVTSFLGAMRIGAVPVAVHVLATPADYLYFLNDSRARVLLVAADLLPKVEPIIAQCPFLRHVVVVDGAPAGRTRFEEMIRGASSHLPVAPTHCDDPAYWLYSSGTTGQPKGVIHLHHDMLFCVEPYVRHVLGLTWRDRTFAVPRLFFSYGLNNSLYLPFLAGAAVVLSPARPEPQTVLQVVGKSQPTLFFSVPTSYAGILREAEGKSAAGLFQSVRLCVSAGEPLPTPIYERWVKAFGVPILDGIGSTEVGYIFISNRPGRVRPGTSGELIPGYEARLLDEEGREVPTGEVGDLWIKGESTAAGYWNKHPRTKATFVGEWIKTGDKYSRDEAGYFTYAGRSDDLLKVGGIWVSPLEVESTLLQHEAVAECAVVGAEDVDGLVKPKAFVVVKKGRATGEALKAELQAFVKERLAPYKYPRWVEFVPELPKTATGKVQRYKLREH